MKLPNAVSQDVSVSCSNSQLYFCFCYWSVTETKVLATFSKLLNLEMFSFWAILLLLVLSILVSILLLSISLFHLSVNLASIKGPTHLAGTQHSQTLIHPISKCFLWAYYMQSTVLDAWIHQWNKPVSWLYSSNSSRGRRQGKHSKQDTLIPMATKLIIFPASL